MPPPERGDRLRQNLTELRLGQVRLLPGARCEVFACAAPGRGAAHPAGGRILQQVAGVSWAKPRCWCSMIWG